MKSFHLLLKNSTSARKFMIFTILFYMCMFTSKTIHPLWFQQNKALVAFGFSYTAMAIAGSLSFFTGFLGDRLGSTLSLRIGVLVYGLGLLMRIYTHSMLIVVSSGFIAGLGASLVIVSLRYWILDLVQEDDRATVVSIHTTGINTGTAIGTLGAGFLAMILGAPSFSYPTVLVLSAILCGFTAFLVPNMQTRNVEKQDKQKGRWQDHLLISTGVVFFGMMSGLSVSMLAPFLPIILKEQGFNIAALGIIIAATSIIRAISAPFFSNKKFNQHKVAYFFFAELITGMLVLMLTYQLPAIMVVFAFLLRSFLLTISVICEELIQLSLFPSHLVGFFFGLLQSAFFIGDALGGSLGGWLFQLHTHYALFVSGGITILNSVLFPLFYTLVQSVNRSSKEGAIDEKARKSIS
ncbi:Cyanate permease [Seinonella peptonophila]|uniref:Cyanate permease n=1 Tax=Seinonella peptonophila TaxID=112248 RepID=A0A1M4ZA36_9BACL|nr:MFS transporter [Seinonella peptonophila]SHF14874.1 Cyanate permease [Seinonella peptonophila]